MTRSFTAHAPHGFWPIVNKGELAVLYCFAFLFIAAHGSGAWSVDSMIARGRLVRISDGTMTTSHESSFGQLPQRRLQQDGKLGFVTQLFARGL